MNKHTIFQFLLMQVGWFACVLGAARGLSWIGPIAVALTLALHIAGQERGRRRREVFVLLGVAALGFVVDTVLLSAGVIAIDGAKLSPPWLVALWPNLAASTSTGGSLASLARRPFLASILGAVAGPLAYHGGAGLGAIHFVWTRIEACILLGAIWIFVLPVMFRLRSTRLDRLLAVATCAATLFFTNTSAAADAAELRARYTGFYRYAGDAAEQRAREAAIEKSAQPFFFAVRGAVRAKLDDRTKIMATCKFEFKDGFIRSTVPGYAVAVSPESGAPAAYRIDDDPIVLSQRFEGDRLVQVFRADEGGMRKNELTLSPDGRVLTMRATLSSPKLATPVVYTLTYRRVE